MGKTHNKMNNQKEEISSQPIVIEVTSGKAVEEEVVIEVECQMATETEITVDQKEAIIGVETEVVTKATHQETTIDLMVTKVTMATTLVIVVIVMEDLNVVNHGVDLGEQEEELREVAVEVEVVDIVVAHQVALESHRHNKCHRQHVRSFYIYKVVDD